MAGLPQLYFADSTALGVIHFADMCLERTVLHTLFAVDCTAIRTIAEKTALFQRSTASITAKATAGDRRQILGIVSHSACLLSFPRLFLTAAGDAFSHTDPSQAGPGRNLSHSSGPGCRIRGAGLASG